MDVHLQPIKDLEDTILLYKAHAPLNLVILLVPIHHVYTLDSCVVLYYHQINRSLSSVFYRVVSLRDICKSISRAEISSPSSLYFKAVKGAQNGSDLESLDCMLDYFSNSEYIEAQLFQQIVST